VQTQVAVAPLRPIAVDTAANFEHPADARISYSAVLADGSLLPAWLTLDPRTGLLSGQAPQGERMRLQVVVTAAMEGGGSASTEIALEPAGAP